MPDAALARHDVLSAPARTGTGQYLAPRWFTDQQRGKPLRWRVRAVDAKGRVLVVSEWHALEIR